MRHMRHKMTANNLGDVVIKVNDVGDQVDTFK